MKSNVVRTSLLTAAALLSLAMLAPASASAQGYENDDLKVTFISAYDPIWNDAGSGARLDGSFWRPTPAPGWFRVGHHAKQGHGFPTESTMVVQEKKPGILDKPLRYEKIWNDAGSGALADVSIWHPICPSGFSALGDVANAGYAEPSTDEVRCVKSQALIAGQVGGLIWNDAGSGAKKDFAAWSVQALPADSRWTSLSRGLFWGTDSYTMPSRDLQLWAIRVPTLGNDQKAGLMSEHLRFAYTENFKLIWEDAGSGAEKNVAFFEPVAPPGYFALGSYAQDKYGEPTDAVVMVVQEKTRGALAAPLNYELIWTDAGSGAAKNGAMWWPSCPPGYQALGLVATSGAKPDADATRCVREDLTVPGKVGGLIYNDKGSGASRDFSAWRVKPLSAPPGEAYISPGTCLGIASHNEPSAARARALKMKLPMAEAPRSLPKPTLSGYGKPSPFEQASVTTEVYLPFTLVNDPGLSTVRMAKESPYYRLVRTDRFQLINHLYNDASRQQTTTWAYSTAIANLESFTDTGGVSLTVGYTTGAEVTEGVAKQSASWSASVTVDYSFSYQKQRTETKTETVTVPIVAGPGEAVAAYCVRSTFQLYRADGSLVGPQAEANEAMSHVIVSYPPAGAGQAATK